MVKRRETLKIAVTGVAALAVGAVGGYAIPQTDISRLKKEVAALQQELAVSRPKLEGDINIYNWTFYVNRTLVDSWAEENGLKLVYDYFESEDEVVAKVRTGASGYDIAILNNGSIEELAPTGLLQPIDLKKVPNFKHVPNVFVNPKWDPGNKYSVIYSYGTTGIGWNSEKVDPPITRWADVFEPERALGKYPKKFTMLPDITETIGVALMYLGRDPNSSKDEDLEEAKKVLIKQKPYLAKYASTEEYMEGLKSERFLASHAWNGDIVGVIYPSDEREIAIEKAFPFIRYTVPEEGAYIWTDNLTIPKGAKNVEAAHAYINFILEPSVSAICTLSVKYPFPTGLKLVPKEFAEDQSIFTPLELFDKLHTFKAFSEEERVKREKIWIEVQAA